MVILQKSSSMSTAISSTSTQPVMSLTDAIKAQQLALRTAVPKSAEEINAYQTQTRLLSNYPAIQKQQDTLTTAIEVQSARSLAYSDFSTVSHDADSVSQASALLTSNNRMSLLAAIKYGVDMWRLQAHFANVRIMGLSAIGAPGCLTGPSLKPWILNAPGIQNSGDLFISLATSIADAVDTNFRLWQDSVTIPGLPWYPSFVAVAAPYAPPVPNIPMPLITCVAQNYYKLASAIQIENQIRASLPNTFNVAGIDSFLQTLSSQLVSYFTLWMVSQMVMMVMGTGPVPTFNPPYVPAGQVVNGYVIPSPGHLAV